ncbi:unnamed protein product [Rotaria sp. Silwood2]|nr:unnamed protein product [Rotaria sp. Silwood2]CAF2526448.1 unnamed protein product [Rotaria sp. Silwood2]CAF3912504.1 unnamed protein product [Rotaria sp. Silwood2]CAF4010593.1 unnamed protein product [Rotaria sp. Silwood2]
MATASSRHNTKAVIADAGDSKHVKLVFDTWTPRSHFIVVQYKPQQDASFDELQATYELIGSFLRSNPQYDNEAILSFHHGQWYQKHTGEWHAHLCVPKEPYLEQAKKWRDARTVGDGINKWYAQKQEIYTKYRDECLKKPIPDHTLVEDVHLSTLHANSREFKLVWMYPAPRIGVKALNPETMTLASLYKFMSEIRSNAEKELGRRDRKFANFGCHLCLYVCGQLGTSVTCRQGQVFTENGELDTDSDIAGYIQMDESQYVQWLPRNLRQKWLNEFGRVKHFVET